MNITTRRRTQVRVEGIVQGVGFRPFVYRLASELGLAGFVFNDTQGVLLEVEGNAGDVDRFLGRLAADAPPLAVLERVSAHDCALTGRSGFQILRSPQGGVPEAPVSVDSATCRECLAELFDPADRRHRYPFINCTNCGPRFTIVRGIPYDRPFTTMAGFEMCERCQAEYDDPIDRRFHAQPNACPACGPAAALSDAAGAPVALGDAPDAVAAAARELSEGRIVAVKGIGGYHLACRADDEAAVATLRSRKHREDKPFALMVATLLEAGSIVTLGAAERLLLSGTPRPIVLCARRAGAPLAPSVAPGVPEVGIMLAYSPLHHLLLADFARALSAGGATTAAGGGRRLGAALVMTSANVSDEPIAFRDAEARERLHAIADLFLTHDRPIETRTDDSVMRAVAVPGGVRKVLLRRSRGYVPGAVALPDATPRPLLACGAQLKNTFCVAKGSRAWVSHHIGDLENFETLRSFKEGIEHFQTLFAVAAQVVVHDLHPEYLSTKYALEREDCEPIGVQHHHAHLAACLAEHGEHGNAVGAIFDGSGYGTDGSIWGGEILVGDLAGFQRVGRLMSVRLPGGPRAIREPWRMACAWLSRCDDAGNVPRLPSTLRGRVDEARWRQVASLVAPGAPAGPHAPLTTSMGRLFDAVAALCGLRTEVSYEGQAAVELEAACDPQERGAHPIALTHDGETLVIDPRETIAAVAGDLAARVSVGVVASRFHAAVAQATVRACSVAASAHGTDLVVLSGGVFQNRRLMESVAAGLHSLSLRVLIPERVPVNDGGISYGQAAVAAHRLATQSAPDARESPRQGV